MYYERLRDLRKNYGLSQEELAKKINLQQRAYGYYETGDRMVPPPVLDALADFYHVSVDYLMGRTDHPTPYPKAYPIKKQDSDMKS